MRRHHTPDPRRRAKLPAEPEPPERTGPALSWEDTDENLCTMFIDDAAVATVMIHRGEVRSRFTPSISWLGWLWRAECAEAFGLSRAGGDFDEKDSARLFCEHRFAEVMK